MMSCGAAYYLKVFAAVVRQHATQVGKITRLERVLFQSLRKTKLLFVAVDMLQLSYVH